MLNNNLLLWRISRKATKLASEKDVGIVEVYTKVHASQKEHESSVPYFIALISLQNEKKVISQVVDCQELYVGMKVEPCLRKIFSDGNDGLVYYTTKFKPLK